MTLFIGDYKTKMNEVVNELYQNKANTTREERLLAVEYYTDLYVEETGERPESSILDRLATLILDEELTDIDRMKMRNNEYPIMSDDQRGRRESEVVSIKWADEIGSDGKDYREKTRLNNRKMRSIANGHLRDKDAHARNKERRDNYREFTKIQPVKTYKINES